MAQIFINNARGVLAASIPSGETRLSLKHGVNLPATLADGDWFLMTLFNDASRYGSNIEVVRVTAITDDGGGDYRLSVERGYEGDAIVHAAGEKVEARITARTLRALLEDAQAYAADKDELLNRENHTGTQTLETISDAGTAAAANADDFVRTGENSTIRTDGDTTLTITANDYNRAMLVVRGDNQGTARVYIGQGGDYGGGIEYNGDGSPVTTGAGADFTTLFRRNNNVDYWTARNNVYSNVWEFREAPTVGGKRVLHTGDTVPEAEAKAGVATTERVWTAQRVRQAVESVTPTWQYVGVTHSADPYPRRWHCIYRLTGTGRGDEEIEVSFHGDTNYYDGTCTARIRIFRFSGESAGRIHVAVTPVSGWIINALVKVNPANGEVWVASGRIWGEIYARLIMSIRDPGRTLFPFDFVESEPPGTRVDGRWGVAVYDSDSNTVKTLP